MANPNPITILVRQVWADNLKSEIDLMASVIDKYPFVSMDTEYPGVIFNPPEGVGFNQLSPAQKYNLLKSNVDALKLIQLGITLSDSNGNLPDLGSVNNSCYIWQFNFSDFDPARDRHAQDSIELLRQHGIDFERNRVAGIRSEIFAELIMSSAVVCNDFVTWITFQGAYDYGYMIKILKHQPLPGDLNGFWKTLRAIFGMKSYDVKHLMTYCNGLHGGLGQAAKSLGLNRAVGEEHQAGSDSLLTWQVFQRMRDNYFGNNVPEEYAGVLHGYADV